MIKNVGYRTSYLLANHMDAFFLGFTLIRLIEVKVSRPIISIGYGFLMIMINDEQCLDFKFVSWNKCERIVERCYKILLNYNNL